MCPGEFENDPLERPAAKPEMEAKPQGVLALWFARGCLKCVGLGLSDTNKIDEFGRAVVDPR